MLSQPIVPNLSDDNNEDRRDDVLDICAHPSLCIRYKVETPMTDNLSISA